MAFLEATMPMFEMTQHLVANVEVRIDGDTATVSAMFNNPMRLPDGDAWFTGGWYHHDLAHFHHCRCPSSFSGHRPYLPRFEHF